MVIYLIFIFKCKRAQIVEIFNLTVCVYEYTIKMKLFAICLVLACCGSVVATVKWDIFMFVELWPGSWLYGQRGYNFTNDYFTVHGLWPEYINGSWPQFCNSSKFNISTLQFIKQDLVKYWTDFRNPQKFWAHEYYKHMSCIEEDPIFQNELVCFKMGLAFRSYYDYFVALSRAEILPSNTMNYTVADVSDAIRKMTGTLPVIICDNNGILNEIRICFDQNVTIIDCPNDEVNKGCKSKYIWYNVI